MLIEDQLARIVGYIFLQLLADRIGEFRGIDVRASKQTALGDVGRDLQLGRCYDSEPIRSGFWIGSIGC